MKKKPIALIILDGWGYSPENPYNAIAAAHTPTWDTLWSNAACQLISASGTDVGLPDQHMGNSEVGHLHMGAGRPIPQSLVRIDQAIEQGIFHTNAVLLEAIKTTHAHNKALHILGLLSKGGVHSHERHIHAMLALAAQQHHSNIYLHLFTDGRDTPPQSAKDSLIALESLMQRLNAGTIASLSGRYYTMDRDKREERTQRAYDCIAMGEAHYQATDAISALKQAYLRGETDEFVQPTCIHPAHQPPVRIKEGDAVVMMNFRADRMRQLAQRLLAHPGLSLCASLTQYAPELHTRVAFAPQPVTHSLGEVLAEHHLKQLRIAETEKYAHVTFFFNGGVEAPFVGEDRVLIPSPKVATYEAKPEMSAVELTDRLITHINASHYDVIICNFANADMVGHTGNFEATVKAVETIDTCLKRILETLHANGGAALITADHGNAEQMYNEQKAQVQTAHTNNPVPLIYTGQGFRCITPQTNLGTLYDVAPTLLFLLGIKPPAEMTGRSLLEIA